MKFLPLLLLLAIACAPRAYVNTACPFDYVAFEGSELPSNISGMVVVSDTAVDIYYVTEEKMFLGATVRDKPEKVPLLPEWKYQDGNETLIYNYKKNTVSSIAVGKVPGSNRKRYQRRFEIYLCHPDLDDKNMVANLVELNKPDETMQ